MSTLGYNYKEIMTTYIYLLHLFQANQKFVHNPDNNILRFIRSFKLDIKKISYFKLI